VTVVALSLGQACVSNKDAEATKAAKGQMLRAFDTCKGDVALQMLNAKLGRLGLERPCAGLSEPEAEFMRACQRCAPAERCEADRLTIRAGKGSAAYSPCRD
jgi:hypothetical protein